MVAKEMFFEIAQSALYIQKIYQRHKEDQLQLLPDFTDFQTSGLP